MEKILDLMNEKIARYDRLVDSSEFVIDQIAYQQCATELRSVRDEVKRIIKNENSKQKYP